MTGSRLLWTCAMSRRRWHHTVRSARFLLHSGASVIPRRGGKQRSGPGLHCTGARTHAHARTHSHTHTAVNSWLRARRASSKSCRVPLISAAVDVLALALRGNTPSTVINHHSCSIQNNDNKTYYYHTVQSTDVSSAHSRATVRSERITPQNGKKKNSVSKKWLISNPSGFTFRYIPARASLGLATGLRFSSSCTLLPFLIRRALANTPDWVISEPCPCSPRIRSWEA